VGLPEQERNEEVMEHTILMLHVTFPLFSSTSDHPWVDLLRTFIHQTTIEGQNSFQAGRLPHSFWWDGDRKPQQRFSHAIMSLPPVYHQFLDMNNYSGLLPASPDDAIHLTFSLQ